MAEEVGKTQNIRVADVFVIGPAMIYGGVKLTRSDSELLGLSLIAFGIATILYNADNYFKQKEALAK